MRLRICKSLLQQGVVDFGLEYSDRLEWYVPKEDGQESGQNKRPLDRPDSCHEATGRADPDRLLVARDVAIAVGLIDPGCTLAAPVQEKSLGLAMRKSM